MPQVDASLDQAVATTLYVGGLPSAYLSIEVMAVGEFRPAYMNVHIFGSAQQTVGMNFYIMDTVQRQADLSATIFGVQETQAALDMMVKVPSPYRYMKLRKDLLTRYFGGFASDANFEASTGDIQGFDPVNPGRILTFGNGNFNDVFRRLSYSGSNAIPTVVYDKYSLPLSSALTLTTVGARVLLSFELKEMASDAGLIFGLFNDQNTTLSDISTGAILAFAVETEANHVAFRGWFGTSSSGVNVFTGLPVANFLNKPLLLEIELISIGIVNTAEFRLFDREVNLDVPIISFQVATSLPVVVDRFSISSIGRRNPDIGTTEAAFLAEFEYVDVERGTGVLYDPVNTSGNIQITEAKWRPFQDRPPFKLSGEGLNTIIAYLSNDGVAATMPAQDDIFVDSTDPIITVYVLDPDSPVTLPDALNPPIIKGSLNPGFSQVRMVWAATHVGTWTLRVNSTGTIDGIEIASGSYPVANISTLLTWDFADLPQVDGTYDVTLYLIGDNGKPTAKRLGIYIAPIRSSYLSVAVANLYTMTASMSVMKIAQFTRTASLNMRLI